MCLGNADIDKARAATLPKDWTQRCISTSLDGASVNTGRKTGLIALWNLRAAWIRLTHGLAHVVELKSAEAWKKVPYFAEDVDKICRDAVSTYHRSGKKQWNCQRVAEELKEAKHRKLTSFCQTRFQRALSNALRALMTNWRATCVHLHELAHQSVCTTIAHKANCLTLRSPLTSFVGRSYLRKFEGYQQLYTVSITGVVDAVGGENEFDRPRLQATVKPHQRGYKQGDLYKSEVVDQFDPTDRLAGCASFELYNKLTSARFVKSALFILDARGPQARLSELTQRDNFSLKSLSRKLGSIDSELQAMEAAPKADESEFVQGCCAQSEIFKGIQVLNEGLEQFEEDRAVYLAELRPQLKSEDLQLTDPVDIALRELFDYETWPDEVPIGFFDNHLQTVSSHYKSFFTQHCGDKFIFKLKREWADLVKDVQNLAGVTKQSYELVWQKVAMSSSIGSAPKLLLEIEQSMSRDTSCNERWFSLMNRLKDKRRNRMSSEVMDDLMFICLHAPKSIHQIKPLLPNIIEIWKEQSKCRGRYAAKWKRLETVVEEMKYDEDLLTAATARFTHDPCFNLILDPAQVDELNGIINIE